MVSVIPDTPRGMVYITIFSYFLPLDGGAMVDGLDVLVAGIGHDEFAALFAFIERIVGESHLLRTVGRFGGEGEFFLLGLFFDKRFAKFEFGL